MREAAGYQPPDGMVILYIVTTDYQLVPNDLFGGINFVGM
jgi:hypothetical protein